MIRTQAFKRVLSLLLVLGCLGIGISGFLFLASLREPPAAREPQDNRLNVEAFRVGSDDIQQTLRGFGTVRADREVILSAEVAGAIERLHPELEVGRSVLAPRYAAAEPRTQDQDQPLVEGDELLVIDQERYLGQQKQIASQIKELVEEKNLTDTELDNAKEVQALANRDYELILADFERKKKLHQRGVLSQAELNRVELEVQQYQKNKTLADRDVNLARQRLTLTLQKTETLEVQQELLEDDLERTVIRPPFDGYISEVFVEEGQYLQPGENVVRITNIDRVEIPIALTLDDYDKLKPQLERGARPQAGLSLHEDEPPEWSGEVFRIAPEANRDTRTITVFVEVDNTRQKIPLLPGTFVFARIDGPTYESDRYKIIPRDAILGGRVFRLEHGIAREVEVTVREKLQSVAVVEGDLNPGDLLVLTNLDLLREGLRVKTGDRVHRLADERGSDPNREWKSYWQILPPAKSTAETRTGPAPSAAAPEASQVTN